ncbi:lamin tail domain-containing protein [Candidatus Bathyarchaeota archaeon]|nr:lamin tail domain-containing protein [Candidatus Bathyarchaeota archaeon]
MRHNEDGAVKVPASIVIILTVILAVAIFAASKTDSGGEPAGQPAVSTVASGANIPVVINEFMADNKMTIPGPDGNYPDWIELYNKGDVPVDLSGMYLTDRLGLAKWRFPAGTMIEPHGHLLIWADGQSGGGALHTSFKLRANGEALALIDRDGQTVLDYVEYRKQIRDVSYGRSPDGVGNWTHLVVPTPGRANMDNPRMPMLYPWPVSALAIAALTVLAVLLLVKRRRKPEAAG